MEEEMQPSTSYGDELDGDSKPLVATDRATLSRQAPVDMECRNRSPTSQPGASTSVQPDKPSPTDRLPGIVPGAGAANNPATLLTHRQELPSRSRSQGSSREESNKEEGSIYEVAAAADSRADRQSISDQYYGASVEVGHLPVDYSAASMAVAAGSRVLMDGGHHDGAGGRRRTRQSRRLPYWVWYMLAKSLGIKVRVGDRPWFGTVMYVATLTFALGFTVTHAWYKGYDIVSDDTKETVVTGSVSIVLVIYWCALGVYANQLAGRLFMTPKFADSVRLHSKTVFKVSAAGIMVVLGGAAVVLNCISTRDIFSGGPCEKVKLSVHVCKVMYVMRVCCAVFTVAWNLLVGIVLLSVCRTHTIGLRRFIRELEEDGRIYEIYHRQMGMRSTDKPPPKDDGEESSEDENGFWESELSPCADDGTFPRLVPYHFAPPSPCQPRKGSRHTSQASAATTAPSGPLLADPLSNSNTQVFSTLNAQYLPPLSRNGAVGGSSGGGGGGKVSVDAGAGVPDSTDEETDPLPLPPRDSNPNGCLLELSPNRTRRQEAEAADDGTPEVNTAPLDERCRSSEAAPCGSGKPPVVAPHSRPIIIIREGSVAAADDATNGDGPTVSASTAADQQVSHQNLIAADPPSFASRSTRSGCESPQQSTRVELGSPRRAPSSLTGLSEASRSADNLSLGLRMLSNDDILLSYWKILSRLRSTSLVMQRWLTAVMMYIMLWSLTFVIWWVKHDATLLGIAEFLVPILIMPIICSAYGEVNFEGLRMLKCICPTRERMDMLFYLTHNPLQLTAFGFVINYGVIAGALGALAIAFSTRLVLDEVNM